MTPAKSTQSAHSQSSALSSRTLRLKDLKKVKNLPKCHEIMVGDSVAQRIRDDAPESSNVGAHLNVRRLPSITITANSKLYGTTPLLYIKAER